MRKIIVLSHITLDESCKHLVEPMEIHQMVSIMSEPEKLRQALSERKAANILIIPR